MVIAALISRPVNSPSVAAPASTTVPLTSTIVPPTASSDLTKDDVDRLFGAGNWFCFPEKEDTLGVKMLPGDFAVRSPLRYIDNWTGQYAAGSTTTQPGGATVELETKLPESECPPSQRDALAAWATLHTADTQPLNRARLDGLLGPDNWRCMADYSYGVEVLSLQPRFPVQYPFTAIDSADSTRYGVGEIAPGGEKVTAWLALNITREQCP